MAWLLAVPVIAFLVFVTVGAIMGKVKVKACCAVADPRDDLRMRGAFADDPQRPDDPSSARLP